MLTFCGCTGEALSMLNAYRAETPTHWRTDVRDNSDHITLHKGHARVRGREDFHLRSQPIARGGCAVNEEVAELQRMLVTGSEQ